MSSFLNNAKSHCGWNYYKDIRVTFSHIFWWKAASQAIDNFVQDKCLFLSKTHSLYLHSMNFTKIYSHDDYDFWRKSFVKSTEQVLSKLHFSLFSRDIVQMRVKFSVHYTVYYVILNNHTWYLRISDLKGSDTYARLNTSVTLRCFITLDIHFSCFVIFLPFEVVL